MTDSSEAPRSLSITLLIRSYLGGFLMGLANLVPGISGGTMLLATGIYDRFIAAVSQVTTFRFRIDSIVLLAIIVFGAGCAIVLGAETLGSLVHEQRWIMFSLFIGLTLGGVPLLWSMIKPFNLSALIGCLVGIGAMALLTLVDLGEGESSGNSFVMLLIAGAAGGATMVLPGVSGSYLLLVLGQYLVILSAISGLKDAVGGDGSFSEPMAVLLPVGIGAVIGIVVVSNVMQWFLQNARTTTLGVLMGFLLGAVLGLWPFHAPVEATVLIEQASQYGLVAEEIESLKPRDWPTTAFTPSSGQILGAFGLVLLGFGISLAITMLGREKDGPANHSAS
ncbi:MAG: hypothetical protein CMJ29_10515 [Phycisphaerae bacterium]|nr:hypothetical protein [Phycisphaerae bacterium]